MRLDNPINYAQANRRRFIEELKEFIRFPTVGTQSRHDGDMKRCAAWLAGHLRHIGMEGARVAQTPGHPIVYAEWLRAPGRPTVLLYGHYDVQPADPLREWRSPPFEPVVRGDDIYGRGACDDKGQMFAHVKALEAYLSTERRLPVNVKCLFEGEEESGSKNLTPFIKRHRRALAADTVVISDMPILSAGRPAITYAMRGGLSVELELSGPGRDLHSGIFGGVIHNPLEALCRLVARLYEPGGRVAIPGFYDRVREWDARERAYMARVGPGDAQILNDAKARRGRGEAGYTLYEATTIRPALTLNGIVGGYQGQGGKAVIPGRAAAKLSFRLVPDQDPSEIERLFRRHVARLTPPTVRSSVRTNFSAKPSLVDRTHPAVRAAAAAYRRGFGAEPVFLRSGGTIPVVNTFQELLGVPTVLMGFALPDDRMHAPNEKFHLPNFFNGIATCIIYLAEVAGVQDMRMVTGASQVARSEMAW